MAEEERKRPQRTAYEQSNLDKPLVMQFFELLQQRLGKNEAYRDTGVWVRTSIDAPYPMSFEVNKELYLTKAIYANVLVRLAYWPWKILFQNDIPYIARTVSIFNMVQRIEIGDPNALQEAKFTMKQLREQNPDFSVKLVTPEMLPFDDVLDHES